MTTQDDHSRWSLKTISFIIPQLCAYLYPSILHCLGPFNQNNQQRMGRPNYSYCTYLQWNEDTLSRESPHEGPSSFQMVSRAGFTRTFWIVWQFLWCSAQPFKLTARKHCLFTKELNYKIFLNSKEFQRITDKRKGIRCTLLTKRYQQGSEIPGMVNLQWFGGRFACYRNWNQLFTNGRFENQFELLFTPLNCLS